MGYDQIPVSELVLPGVRIGSLHADPVDQPASWGHAGQMASKPASQPASRPQLALNWPIQMTELANSGA